MSTKLLAALTFTCAMIATLVLAVPSASASEASLEIQDRETTELIDRLNAFDARAYADEAIKVGDYRLVSSDFVLHGSHVPGLACVAESKNSRLLLFGEHGLGNTTLEKALLEAASRFNRTIAASSGFPNPDVCIPADEAINRPDLAARTAAKELRPKVIDISTAVRAQNVTEVRDAIAANGDINAKDEFGFTALMWALQRKNWSIAEMLIAAGADPFAATRENNLSPLSVAVGTGDVDIVRHLLQSQFLRKLPSAGKQNTYDGDSMPAVIAASLSREDILARLIAHGAMPKATDGPAWQQVLNAAIRHNCNRCVDVLLQFVGSQIGYTSEFQQMVGDELDGENPERLIVLSRGASKSLAYSEAAALALSAAAGGNNVAAIRTILQSGQELNLLTEAELQELITTIEAGRVDQLSRYTILTANRRRALNAAIAANKLSAISLALPPTAKLDQQNTLTPLMYAAMVAKSDTVDYVLKSGSQLDAKIGFLAVAQADESPAGYAMTSPTSAKQDSSQWEDEGRNALEIAIAFGNLSAIPVLTRAGADPELPSGPWPLLLEMARITGNLSTSRQIQLIDVLLQTSPPERKHHRANMLLSSAATWNRKKLYRHLIAAGANPCEDAGSYQRPIAAAASHGDLAEFLLFVKHCEGWDPASSIAELSLKEALQSTHLLDGGSLDVIRYLLKRHVKLPAPYLGLTALGWAVRSNNIELVKLILTAGVDVNEVCEDRTALDAVTTGSRGNDLITLLRAYGAKTASELGIKQEKREFPYF